jgi:hypothetical protein
MKSSSGEEPGHKDVPQKSSNKGDYPPEYLGSVLRAEILPADEESEDHNGRWLFLQRIKPRSIAILIIIIVLVGTGMLCLVGPGRQILENSLARLKNQTVEPTQTQIPTNAPIVFGTPKVLPTSTLIWTKTPTQLLPSRTPTQLPSYTPTQEDRCVIR